MKQMKAAGTLPLTDECHHYTVFNQLPGNLRKYWHQRYHIFSAYDDGIQLTEDLWFGATPEPIAVQIAHDLGASNPAKTALVDLFAGAGGNAIAFALSGRWDRIVAVEKNAAALACAQHNAELYGVQDGQITWVLGDCFEYLRRLREPAGRRQLHPDIQLDTDATALFAAPPWGGPGYTTDQIFDLTEMQPYNLDDLHGSYAPTSHALYLPRNSDVRQLARLAPDDAKLDVVQYCIAGAAKAMVAYVPERSRDPPGTSRD